jgi:DNA-binding NarL/FixJ family response regulator
VGRIRILVADDHTIIRSGLKLLLEQQPDFNIAEANTGRKAGDLVSEHHPEVAVLDIGMPQLNGIEATQQIVANEPWTQVVILSMHSNEGYVLRALKRPALGTFPTHRTARTRHGVGGHFM